MDAKSLRFVKCYAVVPQWNSKGLRSLAVVLACGQSKVLSVEMLVHFQEICK